MKHIKSFDQINEESMWGKSLLSLLTALSLNLTAVARGGSGGHGGGGHSSSHSSGHSSSHTSSHSGSHTSSHTAHFSGEPSRAGHIGSSGYRNRPYMSSMPWWVYLSMYHHSSNAINDTTKEALYNLENIRVMLIDKLESMDTTKVEEKSLLTKMY